MDRSMVLERLEMPDGPLPRVMSSLPGSVKIIAKNKKRRAATRHTAAKSILSWD